METTGGVEVQLRSFLLSALDEGKWSVSYLCASFLWKASLASLHPPSPEQGGQSEYFEKQKTCFSLKGMKL
jgi:hypothetical protein